MANPRINAALGIALALSLYGLFLVARWALQPAANAGGGAGPLSAGVLLMLVGAVLGIRGGPQPVVSRGQLQRLASVLALIAVAGAATLMLMGLLPRGRKRWRACAVRSVTTMVPCPQRGCRPSPAWRSWSQV